MVCGYLVRQGIPRDSIDAMGVGEGNPVVANTTAAGTAAGTAGSSW